MTPYNYTRRQVAQIRRRATELRLSIPAEFLAASILELRACFNGVGPDSWSPCFRRTATRLLRWFNPEALVHDWEYTYQPRTYRAFTTANVRFVTNAIRAAWLDLGPGLAFVIQSARGVVLAGLCQLFGWGGYRVTRLSKYEDTKTIAIPPCTRRTNTRRMR